VVALRSNARWCSDHLDLHCRNGDVVRVLFVIDACDRRIVGWHVSRKPTAAFNLDALEQALHARPCRSALPIVQRNILHGVANTA
jgi:transposase InsO family protein